MVHKRSGKKQLKGFTSTQKKVSKQLRSTEGMSVGNVGDELARLSGISSAQRSKRPKDDPFSQIGL